MNAGITELTPHLEHDAFHVVYDPARVGIEDMQRAIEGEGFTARVIDAPETRQAAGVKLDVGELPANVKAVFERAVKLNQRVLIDVHGPG